MRNVRAPEAYKNRATYSAVCWAARNPDKVREYKKAWKKRHTAKYRAMEWSRENKNIVRRLLATAKSRAKKKGIEFSISADDIVLPDVCPVMKTPFLRAAGERLATAPSIDRIDATKGYVPGNVQILSVIANSMKTNATPEQMRAFASWVRETYGEN